MSLLYTCMRNTGLLVTVSVSELAESRCLTFLLIYFFLIPAVAAAPMAKKKKKETKESVPCSINYL